MAKTKRPTTRSTVTLTAADDRLARLTAAIEDVRSGARQSASSQLMR